jgi:hypothetical protein
MEGVRHLTNDLQAELNKIGSTFQLQSESNTKSIVKFNYKDWAWGVSNARSIQASTLMGLDGKYLQLEEKGIIAGISTVLDVSEMAKIIDKWLERRLDIFHLAQEYADVKIVERYRNLMTLSNSEILNLRWLELLAAIEKGTISFRTDVFETFKYNFGELFPFFSHDNLCFSDVFYSEATFKSPFIFCDKGFIEVGFDRYNSADRNNFRTSSIQQAIESTKKLLPEAFGEVINPLKT